MLVRKYLKAIHVHEQCTLKKSCIFIPVVKPCSIYIHVHNYVHVDLSFIETVSALSTCKRTTE